MILTKCELKLLLTIPSTYDILLAAMVRYNVGSQGRKLEIMKKADNLRSELGV